MTNKLEPRHHCATCEQIYKHLQNAAELFYKDGCEFTPCAVAYYVGMAMGTMCNPEKRAVLREEVIDE